MNKLKINSGLAAIVLVAFMFVGDWLNVLLVTFLMLAFCDVDDKVRDIMVRVTTFYVGFCIASLGWDIIVNGVSAINNAVVELIGTINLFLDKVDQIDVDIINSITAAIPKVMNALNRIVNVLFLLAKFGFVVKLLSGKPAKETPISKKIDEYVGSAMVFVNNVVGGQPAPAPQPVAPANNGPQMPNSGPQM